MTEIQYETKTMKVLRGTEGRSITKWEREGWELVSQDTGTARSTLTFRKAKRPVPVKAMAIGGAAVVVVAGIITGSVLIFSGNDSSEATGSASTTSTTTGTPATPTAVSAPAPPATTGSTTAGEPHRSTAPITQTTVDDLLDRLNAPTASGIATGDRFQITGTLFEDDAWFVGAAGEYTVYLSAKGGTDDLMVFVAEADAATWTSGTQVTMVVEVVEVTINGETTDGWLRAQTTETP